MYWNDSLTIYHKAVSPDGRVSWTRQCYMSCFWKDRTGRDPSGGAAGSTATRIARIPKQVTVSAGDIAVWGCVYDSIDEYTSGNRSTDIRKKHPRSFIVSSVHHNTGDGWPIPHTYIEGA